MNTVNQDVKTRGRSPRGEGERLRAVLLEAATELLAEKENPEEVSVRAVTARAGVSPTALYLHFEGREELVRAVSEECFAELGTDLRAAAVAAGDDPRDRLVAMGHAYLRFARDRPGHYAVLFARHVTKLEPGEEGPMIGMDVFELLVDAIRHCGIGEERAFDDAILVWMSMHGRVSVAVAMPGFPFPDEDHFLAALLARVLGQAV